MNYRAALPGDGLQKLHADWKERIAPRDYKVCNTIWLLDDFSKANGCTRLVPDSNHSEKLPEEVIDNPMAPHPNELLMEAPAGTVVVCNSHTWQVAQLTILISQGVPCTVISAVEINLSNLIRLNI